jgi:hypothetical protein
LTDSAGTVAGNPASRVAMRATLRLSSPAWLAQPSTTSSSAAQSMPSWRERRAGAVDHDHRPAGARPQHPAHRRAKRRQARADAERVAHRHARGRRDLASGAAHVAQVLERQP